MALTDASGNVLVTYTYDTWGNLVSDTDNSGIGLASLNPYRYAGYRFDDATGMYYLMARWYDPSTGRFLSPDPDSTLPDYVYGSNNPVSYYDPSGRDDAITLNEFGIDLKAMGAAIVSGIRSGPLAGVIAGGIYLGIPTKLGNSDIRPVYGPPIPSASGNYVQSSDDSGSSMVEPTNTGGTKKPLRRPYIRKAVRQAVKDPAPKTEDGQFIDPNTGLPIEGNYDLGHKPGFEFWREKLKAEEGGLTQKEFNDRMNNPDIYQIEDPSSNRSRRYELP